MTHLGCFHRMPQMTSVTVHSLVCLNMQQQCQAGAASQGGPGAAVKHEMWINSLSSHKALRCKHGHLLYRGHTDREKAMKHLGPMDSDWRATIGYPILIGYCQPAFLPPPEVRHQILTTLVSVFFSIQCGNSPPPRSPSSREKDHNVKASKGLLGWASCAKSGG